MFEIYRERKIKTLIKSLLNKEQLFFESNLILKKENEFFQKTLNKKYISFSKKYTLKMFFLKEDVFFCGFEFTTTNKEFTKTKINNPSPITITILLSIDNNELVIKCKKYTKSSDLEEIYLPDKLINKLFKIILKNKKNVFNEIKKIEDNYFLHKVCNLKFWDLNLTSTSN